MVIIAFITTVLIIMKKKVAPKLEKERIPARVDLEPVYEEVLPDTNANPCYEVVHPKVNIEMSGNTAYTILTK